MLLVLLLLAFMFWVSHRDPGLLTDWSEALGRMATHCGWSYVVFDNSLVGRYYALWNSKSRAHFDHARAYYEQQRPIFLEHAKT